MKHLPGVNPLRRQWLRASGSWLTLVAALGSGWLLPARAWAAWNRAAFEARAQAVALKQLGATGAIESADILIKAPDVAENGAFVNITVSSQIAGTRAISVLVEKNRYPLIATFRFGPGVEAFVSTRIKMGESSTLRAVVEADGQFYTAATSVLVTLGGCG
jgi:sulfur-oxidizing protein SoxY